MIGSGAFRIFFYKDLVKKKTIICSSRDPASLGICWQISLLRCLSRNPAKVVEVTLIMLASLFRDLT